jgi:hypothetical protein
METWSHTVGFFETKIRKIVGWLSINDMCAIKNKIFWYKIVNATIVQIIQLFKWLNILNFLKKGIYFFDRHVKIEVDLCKVGSFRFWSITSLKPPFSIRLSFRGFFSSHPYRIFQHSRIAKLFKFSCFRKMNSKRRRHCQKPNFEFICVYQSCWNLV